MEERISTMEKYNPATDKWTTMEDMPAAVAYPSCSTVNGKIYLIGGFNSERQPLNTVYEYTPPPISNIASRKCQRNLGPKGITLLY